MESHTEWKSREALLHKDPILEALGFKPSFTLRKLEMSVSSWNGTLKSIIKTGNLPQNDRIA